MLRTSKSVTLTNTAPPSACGPRVHHANVGSPAPPGLRSNTALGRAIQAVGAGVVMVGHNRPTGRSIMVTLVTDACQVAAPLPRTTASIRQRPRGDASLDPGRRNCSDRRARLSRHNRERNDRPGRPVKGHVLLAFQEQGGSVARGS